MNKLIGLFGSVAFLLLAACASPCKPTNESSSCSGLTEQCDVGTKACVTAPKCSTDFDCKSGFACGLVGCNLNCGDTSGKPSDSYCAPGYKCSADFACLTIGTCTPNGGQSQCNEGECDATTSTCTMSTSCTSDATCGNYACTTGSITSGKLCKKSCSSSSDCSGAFTCDTTSGKCK
jgi:hypothetical protein